jgi:hypothetical protein
VSKIRCPHHRHSVDLCRFTVPGRTKTLAADAKHDKADPCLPLAAAIIACTAPKVHDGDTLRCGPESVRLFGVDAPEVRRGATLAEPLAYEARDDLVRAVAQRVEITSPTSADMMGSRIELLRTLAANGGVESAALDVRNFVPKWRPLLDMRENYFYDIPPVRTPRRDKGTKRPRGLKHLAPLA